LGNPGAGPYFEILALSWGASHTSGMVKKPKRPVPPLPRPAKRRNEFGDPADTLYAGGTPLFDEGAGKRAVPKRPVGKKPRAGR
jgi:hypothetical protein